MFGKKSNPILREKKIEKLEPSIYLKEVKMLQKQERIGYFFTLIISLSLVMIMFVVLWLV